jgi:hypothetical protein
VCVCGSGVCVGWPCKQEATAMLKLEPSLDFWDFFSYSLPVFNFPPSIFFLSCWSFFLHFKLSLFTFLLLSPDFLYIGCFFCASSYPVSSVDILDLLICGFQSCVISWWVILFIGGFLNASIYHLVRKLWQ